MFEQKSLKGFTTHNEIVSVFAYNCWIKQIKEEVCFSAVERLLGACAYMREE